MKSKLVSMLVLVLVLVAFLVPSGAVSAQDDKPHKIYLPVISLPAKPAAFRLDTKPLNVYMEDADGVCDGMNNGSTKTADKRHFCKDAVADFVFITGTYYGYFRDAGYAKDIANNTEWENKINVTVDKEVEALMISTFRSSYPGSLIFVQRLKSTTKILVYQPGVFPQTANK